MIKLAPANDRAVSVIALQSEVIAVEHFGSGVFFRMAALNSSIHSSWHCG
jgi:hypothetical protein